VTTRKLQFACPSCGSAEVFYTCTPNCCFNHVCAACGITFEPVTKATGVVLRGIVPPDPLPDATDPTAECSRCESTAVYTTGDGDLVCGQCGAVLVLELTQTPPE